MNVNQTKAGYKFVSGFFILSALFLSPQTGQAGKVVNKSFFATTSFVEGVGKTLAEAIEDAMAAIPVGYQRNIEAKKLVECPIKRTFPIPNADKICDTTSSESDLIRVTIPIVK